MRSWHAWFLAGGVLFLILGLIAREWALVIAAAVLTAYSGAAFAWRSRQDGRRQ
jgi:hypothetical protein